MTYKPNYTLLSVVAIIAITGIWLGLSLAYDSLNPTVDRLTIYEDYSMNYQGYTIPSVKGY